MQSSSVFHSFGQKACSRQNAILVSVPPVCPESLFPSVCTPPQCSTHWARKYFPVNLQSSSVFHPFSQKIFSRQSAILVSVSSFFFFFSSPGTGTVRSSVSKCSAWIYTWMIIVSVIFAFYDFLSCAGYL
jgi:hypothetical protein